ncbi:VCBS domain-containing protein [Bradyrhizobium lablabi]|uniref:VCBS domain-containing protein n=1 Tax=Bradyrhizobium lablabi TaxID=722472 RepID=UPI001BA9745B|nr:VCBS domain-containing protein [Bradyrhizobium lablabi]MBR1121989.1 VCBS domain-containing protein [Bradyrhizobium lablabi]
MFREPRLQSGDEGGAAATLHPQPAGDQATGNIRAAIDTLNHGSGAAGRLARKSVGNRFGLLSLTALTFATMKDAWASDANLTLLDDDSIAFKDLQHGTFELVTKEAVPRSIIVGDPGETIVLSRTGSSVSVSQFTNNAARMEELQAAQKEVYANLTEGYGTHGSGAPTFIDPTVLQPINFVPPGSAEAQDALPALPSIQPIPEFTFIRASLPEPTPTLTLALGTGPTEIDTFAFDTFGSTSGIFSASSSNNAATLSYGISGGMPGATVLDGITYNVSQAGQFGTLYVNSATGAYTFVPDDDAINALKTPTEQNFLVTVSDGTISANQTFTIDIDGVNDDAVISGNASGSLTEGGGDSGGGARLAMAFAPAAPAPRSASGTLTSTDVDDPHNAFTAVDTPTASNGGYGTFTMTADGVWTYTLDDGNSVVQALNVGGRLTDTFTVTTVDGTQQMVTIVIGGINDAAIISGDTEGAVVEAACKDPGIPTATGVLTAADIDNLSDTFTPVKCQQSDGGFGTFTMTADGKWTYTLDNDNCEVQALNVDDQLIDTFTVTTVDGTEQEVTIIIGGTNDAADISGDKRGAVVEAGCKDWGIPTARGCLISTDIDNPSDTFTPVECQASDGGYGTFTMTADGKWTYTLDNNNCAVQSLDDCDTLTDSFTVTTEDGTEQVIKITIYGADDHSHHEHHDHWDWEHEAAAAHVDANAVSDPRPAAGPVTHDLMV